MRNLSLLSCIFLIGCISSHQPMNDEERLDQNARFRGTLYDTSPRAMNRIPKAVPSIKKTYDSSENTDKKAPLDYED